MASPTFVAASSVVAFSAGDGPTAVSKPAGTAENDLMLLFWHLSYHLGSGSAITPPSGWTALGTSLAAGNGTNGWVIYWKVAGASEGSSYTCQQTTNVDGGADRAHIETYTGVYVASPIDALGTAGTPSGTAAPSSNSVTAASADTTLIAWCMENTGGTRTITSPSGMTSRSNRASVPCWDVCSVAVSATGATGAKSFSSSASSNFDTFAFTIASVAAGGGGPVITGPSGKQMTGGFFDLSGGTS